MPAAMAASVRLVRRSSTCLRVPNQAPTPSATAAITARKTVPAVVVTDSESPLRKTQATSERICDSSTNVMRRDSSHVQRRSKRTSGLPHASPRIGGSAGSVVPDGTAGAASVGATTFWLDGSAMTAAAEPSSLDVGVGTAPPS